MTKRMEEIAAKYGMKIVAELPDIGGGAFGAARMAHVVGELQSRLQPSQGQRPGRPSDASWTESPKVPMSKETFEKLTHLAAAASRDGRSVSPMQFAAHLLESALVSLPSE
jgi:hypothetical protein